MVGIKACHICGKRVPSHGRSHVSHMRAHLRAGEAVLQRADGSPATVMEYNNRVYGERFYFKKVTPLLDAGKADAEGAQA